jgi:hypothetical protein
MPDKIRADLLILAESRDLVWDLVLFFGFDHDRWSFSLTWNDNGRIWGCHSFSIDGLFLGELNINFFF